MEQQQVGLKPQEKKGFWEKMGLGQKLLIAVGVILIIIVIIALVHRHHQIPTQLIRTLPVRDSDLNWLTRPTSF